MTQNWRQLYGRVAAFNVRIEENVGGMRVELQALRQRRTTSVPCSRSTMLGYRRTKLDCLPDHGGQYLALLRRDGELIQMGVMIAGTWFVLHGELSDGGFVGFAADWSA